MKFNINPVKVIFLLLFSLSNIVKTEGQHGAKYWIQFTDKDKNAHKIDKPEEFLSQRAIQRRQKNNVAFSEEDLPVSTFYLDSLKKTGVKIMYTSKWFNSATIETYSTSALEKINELSFVKAIEKTADFTTYKKSMMSEKNKLEINPVVSFDESYYGQGVSQIRLENGIFLHNLGFRGKGVQIAVLDVGFNNADKYSSLDSARNNGRILGTCDFVEPGGNVYEDEAHGASVLSVIAANQPGIMVGTSPDASFWLLRSEDGRSEYPVEEDNWVAAAEYADSVGADIISSSLGYTLFDNPVYNHSYSDMNGETLRISKAASIAASKGILVVVSAGNEGSKAWHYISAPADAKNLLAVGATTPDGVRTNFSSYGPAADGRIKPDIAAMGQNVFVQSGSEDFGTASGTSLSAPIIAGLSACLIQAFPTIKTSDIIQAIKMSGNSFDEPNMSLGYGIPDFQYSYFLLKSKIDSSENNIRLFPNPFRDKLFLYCNFDIKEKIRVLCYNSTGSLIFETVKPAINIVNLNKEVNILQQGYYIFRFSAGNKSWVFKAVKQAN